MIYIKEWFPIKEFPDYEITKCGSIRKKKTQKEFIFTADKDGYSKTALRANGKRFYFRVHRLVALNFIPNPDNLPLVNHKNGDKKDNRLENLEWCSHQYNVIHSYQELGRKGKNGGMNKRVAKIDPVTNNILETYESIYEARIKNGLKSSSINNTLKGRSKTSAGFKWMLIE